MPRLIGQVKMVREQIFISVQMAEELRAHSYETGLSKCEIVRRALDEFKKARQDEARLETVA